jgi:hypothetical protein
LFFGDEFALTSQTFVLGILTSTGNPRRSRKGFWWEELQMIRPLQPLSLAGSQLGDERHVCAFFANDARLPRSFLANFADDGPDKRIPNSGRPVCTSNERMK